MSTPLSKNETTVLEALQENPDKWFDHYELANRLGFKVANLASICASLLSRRLIIFDNNQSYRLAENDETMPKSLSRAQANILRVLQENPDGWVDRHELADQSGFNIDYLHLACESLMSQGLILFDDKESYRVNPSQISWN
jgi:DNA-binding IclR family transcriptional regulator